MSEFAAQLAQRRQLLLQDCAKQREELGVYAQTMRRSLASLDNGISVLQRLRRQPLLVAGIAFGLIVLKPQRFFKKAQTALAFWQGAQRVLPVVLPLLQGVWRKWRGK